MPRVPRNRRFKHKKDHDRAKNIAASKQSKKTGGESESDADAGASSDSSRPPSAASSVSLHDIHDSDIASPDPSVISPRDFASPTSSDHNTSNDSHQWKDVLSPNSLQCESPLSGQYSVSPSPPPGSQNDPLSTPEFKIPRSLPEHSVTVTSRNNPDKSILLEVKAKVEMFLKDNCICLVTHDTINVIFLSRSEDKVTQRQLFFNCDGSVVLKVHCRPFPIDGYLGKVLPPKYLECDTVGHFVDRVVQIVNIVRQFEICAGVSDIQYKHVWSECKQGVVDTNPYKECRYSETIRSSQCIRLVNPRKWKCDECKKLVSIVQRKSATAAKKEVHPNTANAHLTSEQKLSKLEEQRKLIKNSRSQLERLRIQQVLKSEGVNLEEKMSTILDEVLSSQNLTPQQSFFLQQQLMAAKAKGPTGRRWHPTMIRFALSIIMKSPSAYNALYESGMLYLPHSRTLFDYSHFKPVQDGIDYEMLEILSKQVLAQAQGDTEYKKYHVLMFDEMYISKNLVFEKFTGRVIGYVSLEEVETELAALQQYLEEPTATSKPDLASKVLTFMIKGVANDVKAAVASYGVHTLTKEQLFRWTWEVITKLEAAGIAVAAMTCDGCSINRAFFRMHTPATPGPNYWNVVFDTVNKAAPERNIYFIADVPHLLKTIRNCFWASSERRFYSRTTGKMMLRRRLQKNGEKILWETIKDLYKHQKGKTYRLAYKLNIQNVYLNSYSKMKVKYAAQVLSLTVAQFLEDLNWKNTKETVNFIRRVNNFFDMLNGAHSHHGVRTNNRNLDPYCTVSDYRFDELDSFLNYLQEWREEATAAVNITVDPDQSAGMAKDPDDQGNNEVGIEDEDDSNEGNDPASVQQLSWQTLEGIAVTVNSFKRVVKFLLEEGTKFINARVFCQDPLEQFFSKQRARGGGVTNPNLSKTLHNSRSINIQGQLGKKRNYSGNTEVDAQSMEISAEPLPKRPSRPRKNM